MKWKQPIPIEVQAPYHTRNLYRARELRKVVKAVGNKLLECHKQQSVDAVAVAGQSGIIVASALSYSTGVPLIVVRKEDEKRHHGHEVTGLAPLDRPTNYFVIDDLISSGDTVHRIIERITYFSRRGTPRTCTGIILYESARECPFTHKGVDIPVYYVAP